MKYAPQWPLSWRNKWNLDCLVKPESASANFVLAPACLAISATTTKASAKKINVPDLRGKSLKKAIVMLTNAGLKVKVNGSGKVIEQFPKPSSLIKNNKLCILTLK